MEYNTEWFIEECKKVHGDKYDYSKVVYTKANNKVIIICKKHGEFEQRAMGHKLGKECVRCGIEKQVLSFKIRFEEFLERSKNKYNDKFNYNKESFIDMSSKMKIICSIHGEIEMTPTLHLTSKTGCSKCRYISLAKSKTKTLEKFLEEAIEKHGDKYNYSKIKEYINCHKKMTIICPKHGDFQQTAEKHLYGGCRKCADDLHASKSRKTNEKFIEEAKKVWGDLYDYSEINYQNTHTKIKILCKIHGLFEKSPNDHLYGQGCQKCKPPKHSKISLKWLKYMMIRDKVHIEHSENGGEHRIKNSLYHADGYCKETNTIYEFYGSYWHGDPKKYKSEDKNKHMNKSFGELYQNTLKKIEHCKANGYNVIECWESDWVAGIKAVRKIQRKFLESRK
jgi:hypothetical protein